MADAAQDLDTKGGALDTAKDLFAGAVGGIAQVLIGKVNSITTPQGHATNLTSPPSLQANPSTS